MIRFKVFWNYHMKSWTAWVCRILMKRFMISLILSDEMRFFLVSVITPFCIITCIEENQVTLRFTWLSHVMRFFLSYFRDLHTARCTFLTVNVIWNDKSLRERSRRYFKTFFRLTWLIAKVSSKDRESLRQWHDERSRNLSLRSLQTSH